MICRYRFVQTEVAESMKPSPRVPKLNMWKFKRTLIFLRTSFWNTFSINGMNHLFARFNLNLKRIFHAIYNYSSIHSSWELYFKIYSNATPVKLWTPNPTTPHALVSLFVQAWICVSKWWFMPFILNVFQKLVLKKIRHEISFSNSD
jgi:hypothetical protein